MELTYDETFVEGDLITTYLAGVHRFVKYEPRQFDPPLIHFIPILSKSFRPIKAGSANNCDASYCRRFDPVSFCNTLQAETQAKIDTIMSLTKP
jgi:hypothetical protein